MKHSTRSLVDVHGGSRAGELRRDIDDLIGHYISTGDASDLDRADLLSREREELLKPAILRSGHLMKAG